jgi:Zn-dependent peptidase ImmA (M78 family)
VTPRVLEWAIRESGYQLQDLAPQVRGGVEKIQSWIDDKGSPSLSEAKALAAKLHRQLATLLLPEPPPGASHSVRFRHRSSASPRTLNPIERRFLRRATRLQATESWILQELGAHEPSLPKVDVSSSAATSAAAFRESLKVSWQEQVAWKSGSQAFDRWREAVEGRGAFVMLFSMGSSSVQGFALWDRHAPLVAINTAWRDEARIFTLFHEVGHLLTRTDSACALAPPSTGTAHDPAERWCEEFAAVVTIPEEGLAGVDRVTDLKGLSRLAARYSISLRAMAIRLIRLDKASWHLYKSIPPASDGKRRGAGGDGRTRFQIREDEIGHRGTQVFVDGVRNDVITESQARRPCGGS